MNGHKSRLYSDQWDRENLIIKALKKENNENVF